MGLVSDETRERIRNEVDFADVLGRYTHTPRPGINHTKWFCPFHDDGKSPAMDVHLDSQRWHCFSCDIKGDIIDFVRRQESLDYQGAVKLLCEWYGIEYKETGKPSGKSREERSLYRLLQDAEAFYIGQLAANPAALSYLRETRGFTEDTVTAWGLGWSPGRGTLYRHLSERGYSLEEMLASGMVRQNEGREPHDFFYSRVMFPIRDAAGKPVSFGGRLLAGKGPKYLNGPDTAIFHKGGILYGLHLARKGVAEHGSALVLEGYVDVIMAHQAGLSNAVGVLGVAVTDRNLENISKLTKTLYLALDNDAAGQRAASRAADLLGAVPGLSVFATVIPPGIPKDPKHPDAGTVKDADEFFRSGRTAGDFRDLMAASPGIYPFVVGTLVASFDTDTPPGRERAYNEAIGFLRSHQAAMTPFQVLNAAERLAALLGLGIPGVDLARLVFGEAGTAGPVG